MIGRVRGTLVSVRGDRLVVDVAGVGYEVSVPTRAVADLPPVGEEVVLHTHLYVREDVLALFGFPGERELATFRLLIGAPGIGPKVGLAILSTLAPDAVTMAVVEEDVATLALVPGIGKRTAQKLVVELKPRFSADDATTGAGGVRTDVRLALAELGFSDAEVGDVLGEVDPTASPEDQVRAALRALGERRRG